MPPPAPATCGVGHDGQWPDFATGLPKDFEAGAKGGCAPSIRLGLKADGVELPTSRVEIGHAGTNPTSVPFAVQRAY